MASSSLLLATSDEACHSRVGLRVMFSMASRRLKPTPGLPMLIPDPAGGPSCRAPPATPQSPCARPAMQRLPGTDTPALSVRRPARCSRAAVRGHRALPPAGTDSARRRRRSWRDLLALEWGLELGVLGADVLDDAPPRGTPVAAVEVADPSAAPEAHAAQDARLVCWRTLALAEAERAERRLQHQQVHRVDHCGGSFLATVIRGGLALRLRESGAGQPNHERPAHSTMIGSRCDENAMSRACNESASNFENVCVTVSLSCQIGVSSPRWRSSILVKQPSGGIET